MSSSNNTRDLFRDPWFCILIFLNVVVWVWAKIEWIKDTIWPWIMEHTDSTLFVTLIATVVGALIVRWIINRITFLRFSSKPFITFEADSSQVLSMSKEVPNLKYSVGEKRWEKLGTQNVVFGGNRGKLMLKGRSTDGTNRANISFATDAQVICTGDIRTLINYKRYYNADTKNASFSHLFEGCTQLVLAPELPATQLANYCYMLMFSGCTSLKTAPELPATEMAECCYAGMFNGCTSLKTTPKLPATELADTCYGNMFSGCTALKTAPELPATEMAEKCYDAMFSGCTSLKTAPDLPSSKLAFMCYSEMFSGCTSLKTAPELPATQLAKWCYSEMFSGCTSLKNMRFPNYGYNGLLGYAPLVTDPDLPAMELVDGCYSRMFSGCSSLSVIYMIAVNVPNKNCLGGWLKSTSPTGTLYKNKNAHWDDEGIVPEGWEVVLVEPVE